MSLPASVTLYELKLILAAGIWDVASRIKEQEVLKWVKK